MNPLNEKFERTINKCDICLHKFNRENNKPLIICNMHHTICQECLELLKSKPNCPFCRQLLQFDKIVINNYIYELLPREEVVPNVRREIKREDSWNSSL